MAELGNRLPRLDSDLDLFNPRDMQQLNLQRYGLTDAGNFSEEVSTFKSVTLTPDPVIIELRLVAPDGEQFVELRLDPDDKPATFVLFDLNVRSDTGAELY